MATLIMVSVIATGLIILGWRVVSIGSAQGIRCKFHALTRCIVDWGLSLGLAYVGAITGGVIGGAAGLLAGPIVSWLVSRQKGGYDGQSVSVHNQQETGAFVRRRQQFRSTAW